MTGPKQAIILLALTSLFGTCSHVYGATAKIDILEVSEVEGAVYLNTMAHDGSTGYGYIGDASPVPFRWSVGAGIELLDDFLPSSPYSSISDTSADGSVVVGTSPARSETGLFDEPYLWDSNAGLSYPDGPEPLPFLTKIHWAAAVSGDGSVVLINRNNQDYFLWNTADGSITPTGLRDAGGRGTLPHPIVDNAFIGIGHALGSRKGLTNDGSILVGSVNLDGGGFAAARLAGTNQPTVIGPEGSVALLTSPDGEFTAGSHAGGLFAWSEGRGFQSLGRIGVAETVPTGLSDDGNLIVGYYRNLNRDLDYFVWTPQLGLVNTFDYFYQTHGLDLESLEYRRFSLVSVSGDGRVFAGRGEYSVGGRVSYIITVVPEPGTALLALFVLVATATHRNTNPR